MEFGQLNQDALWVMDEVQLMDVSFATSGQLQVFRGEDRSAKKSLRPCFNGGCVRHCSALGCRRARTRPICDQEA